MKKIVAEKDGTVGIVFSSENYDLEINSNQKMRAASIVKLLILIEGFRQIDKGIIKAETYLKIDEDKLINGTGVISYLAIDCKISIKNLLTLMVIVSDNTASNTLMDILGIENISELACRLNCTDTKVQRKFMDEEAISKGLDNEISASDCLKILKTIGEPNEILSEKSRLEILKILANQQSKQLFPFFNNYNTDVLFLNKTGQLKSIEHDIGIILNNSERYYLAVLSQGWRNNSDGQCALKEIGKAVMDELDLL